MKRLRIFLLLLLAGCGASYAQMPLSYGFDHPQDSARTKVWWFFGETETTREGITADLEAFKREGVGGVVYYDQVHGKGDGADQVFSPAWWQHLVFAAQEAKRVGLTFEANIGNGYVAGGKWITPDRSMQRLAMSEQVVTARGGAQVRLGLPRCPYDWHHDVAVLAVPYKKELLGDSKLLNAAQSGSPDSVIVFDFRQPFTARSLTYETTPRGKARTSSMQVPPTHQPLAQPDPSRFFGCGFRELPGIGTLEVSDDGIHYTTVCNLRPKYQNLGGLRQQTVAFPATTGRYFRLVLNASVSGVVISARARVDEWEEKASLVSEFIDADDTPKYAKEELLATTDMVDLTDNMAADGTLTWPDTLAGDWLVMRFVSVSTGARTKHGRAEALGLECNKLAVEGARQHWQCYTKPLIDSIRAHGADIAGICMDSHEAGPQNWTQTMERDFRSLRGYDIRPFLPTVAAGLIVSEAGEVRSASLLKDLRRTISDLITRNYYGEFNRLCHEEGLVLTAQAVGGALCMAGDAIEVKKLVDKPQGEFWGYQTEGNYDIKDCSSAAHVYGKPIASGEAYTDITYKHSLADIKHLADYAYAFGINEFVVCAVAYQKGLPDSFGRTFLSTANGRQYVLNRLNTLWPMSRDFWDWQARCSWLLRQGQPVSDFALYLGDDVPKRTLSHLLPDLPRGCDFDAMTTDVLLRRLQARDGRIVMPHGVSYSVLLLPADEELTPAVRRKVDELRQAGVPVWNPHDGQPLADFLSGLGFHADVDAPKASHLYMAHRRTACEDIYFLDNHGDEPISGNFVFRTAAATAELWDAVTGQRYRLDCEPTADGRTAARLTMTPRQSFFVVLSNVPSGSLPRYPFLNSKDSFHVSGPWHVAFDHRAGGPEKTLVWGQPTDWTESSDERIRHFSGTAVYRNTFRLSEKEQGKSYALQFSKLGGAARVLVNGREAGAVWCAPWQLDITPFVKKGKNSIEIRVANCLWNRLVGDSMKPESERIMQQSTPLAKPADALVPSGIVGDVLIVAY